MPPIEDKLRADPMDRDLSWTTWYGFGVLSGLKPRTIKTLKTNDNQFSLVQDTVTKRLFLRKNTENGLVQFWEDDLDQAKMFAPHRVIYTAPQ
jgi:hypothetical protein